MKKAMKRAFLTPEPYLQANNTIGVLEDTDIPV